jgi:hypothetical protein
VTRSGRRCLFDHFVGALEQSHGEEDAGQQRLGGIPLASEHQETHVLDMRMVRLAERSSANITWPITNLTNRKSGIVEPRERGRSGA